MSHSLDAFNVIASDIGVKRFVGEEEGSFCRRIAYSAARFWVLAFCMDDGVSGEKGLTKQAINRRLKNWVSILNRIRPDLEEWFDADGKGIQIIYNRLIDLGDLALNGFSGSYVATLPVRLQLSENLSCITGYFDPTAKQGNVCGCSMDSLMLSGLVSLVQSKGEVVSRPSSWWVRDLEYLNWERASDYGEVKFADVHALRWNVNHSDVWTDAPLWVDDLTLARVDSNGGDSIFFVATKARGYVRLSRITRIQSQELFFYLRHESGCEAVAKYAMLDDLHAKAALPVGFVPGHANRFLDAIGWPVKNAADRFNRIIRAEALPLVEELLSTCYIGFKGVSDDR